MVGGGIVVSAHHGIDSRNDQTINVRAPTRAADKSGNWVSRRWIESKGTRPSRYSLIGANSCREIIQLSASRRITPALTVRQALPQAPDVTMKITVIPRSRKKIDVAIQR